MTRGVATPGVRAVSRAALLALALAGPARGAAATQKTERELLLDVTALESAGDYEPADSLLRSVLSRNPTSLGAIMAFERIAALRGRVYEILPVVDSLLHLDPGSIVGHQIRIRTLSRLNRQDDLELAAEEWIAAMPRIETPYREIARVWRSRDEFERAITVLQEGRKRVRREDALALELGDAWADLGDSRSIVREWSRAIGPDGEAFLLVQRRLAGLPDAGASVIPGLVDALVEEPTTPARRRAAVQLAIEAGLDAPAQSIAAGLLAELEKPERTALLVELGRRADGAGLRHLALWAYGGIVSEGAESDAMLPLRARVAELALALGDTAQAAEVYREIEGELEPGSPERRQARLLRIQMLARERAFDEATRELADLVDEPGSIAEADLAAAALANAMVDAGMTDPARAVLTGLHGPQTSLARGRVLLMSGEADRARTEILAAAPALAGPAATEAIRLASLLGRLSSAGEELVGESLAAMSAGDPRGGIMRLYDGAGRLNPDERAAVLDFAASQADRLGLTAEADQIRHDIVATVPDSPEAPVALLALARDRVDRKAGDEARLLLERLIVDYPRSALAPQARRELERLASQKRQPQ